MKRVNCLGVLVLDALSGPLRQYPVPGEVTQVVTDTIRFMPGGGAANTSMALARMGVSVSVFSKVGRDPNGALILEELRARGVAIEGICVSEGDTTPFTFVGIHPGGERTFIHTPGANRTFKLEDLDRHAVLDADLLIYQDLWVLPNIDGAPGAKLLAEARSRGVVTLLDECWGLGPRREAWEAMLPSADYALPSFDEMAVIYPGCSAREITEELHRLGARTVVLKLGKEGCVVSADGAVTRIGSYATNVVDTTGAGDCFNAGFIAGLVRGLSAVDAAHLGSLAAAACIRQVGGSAGVPPLETLLADLPPEDVDPDP